MPDDNYKRGLQLMAKRIREEISGSEFAELNSWVYESQSHQVLFSVLTNYEHATHLDEIAEALKKVAAKMPPQA